MHFLRALLSASMNDKPPSFFKLIKGNNNHGVKKHKALFAFSTDAFFPATKWKMPKKVITALIIAVAFQFIGFSLPALAQEAIGAATHKQFIVLSNGTVLSKLESELAQKKLVILGKEPVVIKQIPPIGVVGADDIEPLHVQSAVNTAVAGQFTGWGVRTITSYNSEVGQTDDSPCTTANGFNVCEHGIEDTIAANFLKFGTKVTIPDLFGDRIFVVRDRMNQRYTDRVDVWMVNKADSKAFGVRRAEIKVLVE